MTSLQAHHPAAPPVQEAEAGWPRGSMPLRRAPVWSEAEVLERSSEGTNVSPGAGSSLKRPWERFPQRGISMHHFDVFKPTTTKGRL